MTTRSPFTPRFLGAALALLLGGAAHAQQTEDDGALAEARAELARAAARVAELSQERIAGDARIGELQQRLAGRPVLGVLLAPDPRAGVRIAGVTPDGAAAEAGLRGGDRLVSIDGSRILGSSAELRAANARKLLAGLAAENPVRLGYERDGRAATVAVTPKVGRGALLLRDGDLSEALLAARIQAREGLEQATAAMRDVRMPDIAAEVRAALAASDVSAEVQAALAEADIAAELRTALAASGLSADCGGEHCAPPMLLSAFRWNGLNLAEIDPQLGRYFGAERGVLVLSTGDLDGLQPGDVIQRIDGREVDTPREAMAALRDKPADAKVSVAYLRDRKAATTQVTVPKLRSLRIPAPPRPPRPPAAPGARAPETPPAPPKPPAPPAAAAADAAARAAARPFVA
ncbi:PDZ domain-containing protein [Luteimonas sp. R10]|uniref:PDZ domain-containing protein n=1 Tax=Luteimonas sp. R10 TaxID=3108176 RepID=UPI00308743A7|nr:PDZ domain-containing protein [Luteimonas sp. R10]